MFQAYVLARKFLVAECFSAVRTSAPVGIGTPAVIAVLSTHLMNFGRPQGSRSKCFGRPDEDGRRMAEKSVSAFHHNDIYRNDNCRGREVRG